MVRTKGGGAGLGRKPSGGGGCVLGTRPWGDPTPKQILDVKEHREPEQKASQTPESRSEVVPIAPIKVNQTGTQWSEKRIDVPPVKSTWRTLLSRKDNHKLSAPQDKAHHVHRHSPLQPPPSLLPPRLQRQTFKDASSLRSPPPPCVAPTRPPAVGAQPTRKFIVTLLFLVPTTAATS